MFGSINKWHGLGNITRDIEIRSFQSGAKVASFAIACNERKKNSTTGAWEDKPFFMECKVWQNDKNKQVDTLVEWMKKGNMIYVEGALETETWEDKNGGGKRSKTVCVVRFMRGFPPKEQGRAGGGTGGQSQGNQGQQNQGGGPAIDNSGWDDDSGSSGGNSPGPADDGEIPF